MLKGCPIWRRFQPLPLLNLFWEERGHSKTRGRVVTTGKPIEVWSHYTNVNSRWLQLREQWVYFERQAEPVLFIPSTCIHIERQKKRSGKSSGLTSLICLTWAHNALNATVLLNHLNIQPSHIPHCPVTQPQHFEALWIDPSSPFLVSLPSHTPSACRGSSVPERPGIPLNDSSA